MARLENGANGGFRGKAGSIIGFKWGDNYYIKGLPKKSKKKPTASQVACRSKFGYTSSFLKTFTEIVKITFKHYPGGKTAQSSAHSYLMNKAVKGEFPDFTIDYSAVLLSYGDLPAEDSIELIQEGNGILSFSWKNSWNGKKARHSDSFMVIVYEPRERILQGGTSIGSRGQGKADLKLPEYLLGKLVQVYIAFISDDRKLCSNSKYLGEITVI
jgi:hypothetical protein